MKKTKKVKLDPGFFHKDLKRRLNNKEFREAYYMAKLVKRISRQIEELRKKKHLTQKQLADRSGVPQQEISKIEKGDRNITLNTLEKLAEGFGGSVEIKIHIS